MIVRICLVPILPNLDITTAHGVLSIQYSSPLAVGSLCCPRTHKDAPGFIDEGAPQRRWTLLLHADHRLDCVEEGWRMLSGLERESVEMLWTQRQQLPGTIFTRREHSGDGHHFTQFQLLPDQVTTGQ